MILNCFRTFFIINKWFLNQNYQNDSDIHLSIGISNQEENSEISKEPVYRDEVANSILQSAAKIFLYLTNCPEPTWISWNIFYKDLMENFPARIILQNLYHINNVSAMADDHISYKVSEQLIQKLSAEQPLLARTIEMISTSHNNLRNSKIMGTHYQTSCLHNITHYSIDSMDTVCGSRFINLGKLLACHAFLNVHSFVFNFSFSTELNLFLRNLASINF